MCAYRYRAKPPGSGAVRNEVRSYYRTVSRFIDRERLDRPDRELWRSVAAEHRGGSALDLGCGTGQVARLLARELARVVGIDLSLDMLARAAERVAARTGTGRGGAGRGRGTVSLIAADLRRLALGRRFDLVVAANDPLAHLGADADRDRALAGVAAHLVPGGRFLLDALWFPPARLARALSEAGLVLERPGRELRVRETWRCRPDGSCLARYEYRRGGELLAEAEFHARYWSEGEVRERLERAGLELTALWGDYDRSPWRPESARRLVVEARPAGGSGRGLGPAAPTRGKIARAR